MDESNCFFKVPPDKGLVENGKQAIKIHDCLFFNAAGEKVEEPVVIWKSGMPHCFRGLRDPSRPANAHYSSNPKSWMTSVMLAVLQRFTGSCYLSKKRQFCS